MRSISVNDYIDVFEELYSKSEDPWGYDHRWYEARKKQICLALLTRPHYINLLEIGCSNGHLSEHLAQRADRVLSIDASENAIQLASKRLHGYKHVKVEQRRIPNAYPSGHFDLIVMSEVAYYLTSQELHQLIHHLTHSLTPHGEILCCHWRQEIEGFELDAQRVHESLRNQLPFHHYLTLSDPDFIIDLWTVGASSLAQQEGSI